MIHFYVVVWQPQIVKVVLKVHMHCEACAQGIKKRIQRMKGVSSFFFFFKEKLILRLMQFWLLVVIMISSTKKKKVVIMKYESVGNQRSCPFVYLLFKPFESLIKKEVILFTINSKSTPFFSLNIVLLKLNHQKIPFFLVKSNPVFASSIIHPQIP